MLRLAVCMVALVGSSPSFARGSSRAEAQRVVEQFVAGAVGLNQVLNRLDFLGERAWAANELTVLLRRTPGVRARGQLLTAIAALGEPGDEEVGQALVAGLAFDDLAVRLAVLRALGRVKYGRALTALTALLNDPSAAVRREAAAALGALSASPSGAPLARAAHAEEDLEARVAMLWAVGRVGDRHQAGRLVPFLTDPSESTRLAAAQALCLLGDQRGFLFARALLRAPTSAARLQGVLLFDGLPATAAAAPLRLALADADPQVRAVAGRVLYQGGDQSKLQWLVLQRAQAQGAAKLVWEEQLEQLHLTAEERTALFERAGEK